MMSDLSLGWLELPTVNMLSLGKRVASNSDVIYAMESGSRLVQLTSLGLERELMLGNSTSGC